jgi:sortase A
MTDTIAPETAAPEAPAPELAVDDTAVPPDAPKPASKKPGRWRRRIGTFLIVFGILALAYGAAIYFWRDPITDLYARWKQHGLAAQLDKETAAFRASAGLPVTEPAAPPTKTDSASAPPTAADRAKVTEEMHRLAQRFYDQLEPGQPLGRIIIPRLGLNAVFVNGTQWGRDLSRGPGRYPETSVPGLGKLTAIAGHRTTFGAPFRHIDDLKPGDTITLKMPDGTFVYRVFKHEIVDDEDWSIIRPRSFETLVLSACHPLYSASHRYIVYARLTEAKLPNGDVWRAAPKHVTLASA